MGILLILYRTRLATYTSIEIKTFEVYNNQLCRKH